MGSSKARKGADHAESFAAEAAPLDANYDATFEFATECRLETDSSGIIRKANHASTALLQMLKDFLPGKPLAFFLGPPCRYQFYDCLSRFAQGIDSYTFEAQLLPFGKREPRELLVMAWARPDQPDAIRWQFRDVTERKRAEVARAELLRRLVTVQEDERRRIARDLHDNVGQLTTALAMGLTGCPGSS